MKSKFILSVAIIIALIYSSFNLKAQEYDKYRGLTVFGESSIKIIPDIATFRITIFTIHKNNITAKNENDRKINEVYSIFKKFNIPDKNIKTFYISCSPMFKDEKETEIIGFKVMNHLQIRLNDISIIDSLLNDLFKANVTEIDEMSFTTSDFGKYKNEAQKVALKSAKEKALFIATELGLKVGKPLYINEHNMDVIKEVMGTDTPNGIYKVGYISINARFIITYDIE